MEMARHVLLDSRNGLFEPDTRVLKMDLCNDRTKRTNQLTWLPAGSCPYVFSFSYFFHVKCDLHGAAHYALVFKYNVSLDVRRMLSKTIRRGVNGHRFGGSYNNMAARYMIKHTPEFGMHSSLGS